MNFRNETVKQLLFKGRFSDIWELTKQFSFESKRELLIICAYETENITVYSCIVSWLCRVETAELHYLASELLSMPLCHVPGAYSAALFHGKRATELAPDNVGYQEYLLFFYRLPDPLLSKQEAKNIAKKVLSQMPESKVARAILEEGG